jgi:alpha-beta hydrolase superfamily lysophospholipase
LLVVPAVDLAYSRWVALRWRRWERGVQRDGLGVKMGCGAFSVGDGAGAVLFIHGFADSPAAFRHMAPALAARGYTCRAMRLPGCAEPLAAQRRVDRANWSAAVAQEVKTLRAGHRPVWLLGHSAGAALAVRHALARPGAVDGLVLLAPLFGVSHRRSPVLSPRRWLDLARHLLVFTDVVENPFPLDVHRPRARGYPYRDLFIPWRLYCEAFALADEAAACASRLDLPVLMVLAREDRVVDTPEAERFFLSLPPGGGHRIEYADGGHHRPFDSGWEMIVDHAAAFLRRHGAAGDGALRGGPAESNGGPPCSAACREHSSG